MPPSGCRIRFLSRIPTESPFLFLFLLPIHRCPHCSALTPLWHFKLCLKVILRKTLSACCGKYGPALSCIQRTSVQLPSLTDRKTAAGVSIIKSLIFSIFSPAGTTLAEGQRRRAGCSADRNFFLPSREEGDVFTLLFFVK